MLKAPPPRPPQGVRQSVSLSLRGSNATVAIRFPFKGEADSFVLCTQNDKSFSCHEYRVVCAVSCRPVIANAVRRVTIRFFSFGVLRILSRFAFRMTNRLVKVNSVRCAAIRFSSYIRSRSTVRLRRACIRAQNQSHRPPRSLCSQGGTAPESGRISRAFSSKHICRTL